MFDAIMHNCVPVKLCIGFIVQNINTTHSQLSPFIKKELDDVALLLSMTANIKLLSAAEALDDFSIIDGLFISGKHNHTDDNYFISSAEKDNNLAELLAMAISEKIPVLGNSYGFEQMNNSFINTESLASFTPKVDMLFNSSTKGIVFNTYGLLGRMFPGRHYQKIQIDPIPEISALSSLMKIEAKTEDNEVVAFSLASKDSFYLAIKWQFQLNEQRLILNQQIIKSFTIACRKKTKKQSIKNQNMKSKNGLVLVGR